MGPHPAIVLAVVCLTLVVATWFAYNALGSDLLPEMDEGAFILDYLTPAGTSLTETNRILQHVEQILRSTPEVEITSRRTGLQLGLAAVTEANSGDFSVRLKPNRDRDIEEIMADVRDRIKKSEPALDVEFIQVLQDMIGDLSNSPEPIQIKLFSSDSALLNQLGPRWKTPSRRFPASWTRRTAWTTPSPALPPASRSIRSSRAAWDSRPARLQTMPPQSSTACPPPSR